MGFNKYQRYGILVIIIFGVFFISGCKQSETIDCGTTSDIYVDLEYEEELYPYGRTDSNRNFSNDDVLVCIGNNLFGCRKGTGTINFEGSSMTIETNGKEGTNCIIKVSFGETMSRTYSKLAGVSYECPIPMEEISSYGYCPNEDYCYKGLQGFIAEDSIGKFMTKYNRAYGDEDKICEIKDTVAYDIQAESTGYYCSKVLVYPSDIEDRQAIFSTSSECMDYCKDRTKNIVTMSCQVKEE